MSATLYNIHGSYDLLAKMCVKLLGEGCPYDMYNCCPFEEYMDEEGYFVEDSPKNCNSCSAGDWENFFE